MQIVVPARSCRRLGLAEGAKVTVIEDESSWLLKKRQWDHDLQLVESEKNLTWF
jgi:bifunctional DNA-binding transcriptional regulator/antitoxin component of YhaV-PrlF toxin-antitoxin module